jgi:hypothetical protein
MAEVSVFYFWKANPVYHIRRDRIVGYDAEQGVVRLASGQRLLRV